LRPVRIRRAVAVDGDEMACVPALCRSALDHSRILSPATCRRRSGPGRPG
jgi:hypothetical protein